MIFREYDETSSNEIFAGSFEDEDNDALPENNPRVGVQLLNHVHFRENSATSPRASR